MIKETIFGYWPSREKKEIKVSLLPIHPKTKIFYHVQKAVIYKVIGSFQKTNNNLSIIDNWETKHKN